MKSIIDPLRKIILENIINGEIDRALELLSKEYNVSTPKYRIGTVKGHRSAAGCYIERKKTIVFANSEIIRNPLVVLHEFYHHMISSVTLKGGGTDKNAERFVRRFLSTKS
ncbi:hypothetical protein [[Eubacterium] cellulosolvens]